MHAVGGRARDEVHSRLGLEDAQRHIEGERVAGTALVAIRGDDRHLGQRRESLAQPANAFGSKAVIVADQDFHLKASEAAASAGDYTSRAAGRGGQVSAAGGTDGEEADEADEARLFREAGGGGRPLVSPPPAPPPPR